jgi:hypothetical protein
VGSLGADGSTGVVVAFESLPSAASVLAFLSLSSTAGLTAGFSLFLSLVSTGVLLAASFLETPIASLSKWPCSYSYSNSLMIFFAVGRV